MEPMTVIVEVWPVSVDDAGIWLVAPEAWRSGEVPSDDEPHSEVNSLLYDNGIGDSTKLVHSTSWRVDGPWIVLSYVAVIDRGHAPDVRDRWPHALPISGELLHAVGHSAPGPATEPPTPRYVDVLMHAIRHLRFLLDYDGEAADVLVRMKWDRHLRMLAPTLAGMYENGLTNGMPATGVNSPGLRPY